MKLPKQKITYKLNLQILLGQNRKKFDGSHFYKSPTRYCTIFKEFQEKTDQLIELIKDMNQTTCELDLHSTKPTLKCLGVLKGTLTKMITLSLRMPIHSGLELAIVKPLI